MIGQGILLQDESHLSLLCMSNAGETIGLDAHAMVCVSFLSLVCFALKGKGSLWTLRLDTAPWPFARSARSCMIAALMTPCFYSLFLAMAR